MTTEQKLAKVREALEEAFDFVECDKKHSNRDIAIYAGRVCDQINDALKILYSIHPAPSDAEKELIADAIAEGILNSSKFKAIIRAATAKETK